MDCPSQLASMAIEEREENRDYKYAIKLLTTGIKIDPNNQEAYFERSICHYKLGDFKASLDDADMAIRLNASHHNIHYQRALALIGLSMFSEAVTAFKKAIELRARQEDSKLSDIFKLLRDATNELNSARRRPGATGQTRATLTNSAPATGQATNQSPCQNNINNQTITTTSPTTSKDPVDSTTDRQPIQAPSTSQQQNHHNHNSHLTHYPHQFSNNSAPQIDNISVIKNRNASLVGTKCNNNNNNNNNLNIINNDSSKQLITNSVQFMNNMPISNGATNTQNHMIGMQIPQVNTKTNVTDGESATVTSLANLGNNSNDQTVHHFDKMKQQNPASFDWNIRRSERIFLNHTNEPGTSTPQYGIIIRNGTEQIVGLAPARQRSRVSSGSPSLNSVVSRGTSKRQLDSQDIAASYTTSKVPKSGESAQVDSDIDVDDSCNFQNSANSSNTSKPNETTQGQKRVVITPSSSMPATSQIILPTTKDDSYSSKYKRLRRDRERARRGTSKLCTIKSSYLEELQKPSPTGKRFMRVIAPIDGWLYSGQLSLDDNRDINGGPQYVVKLDGDTTGSSYLFSQETVLSDVIKEVKVKTVSELRKGARICCYWSRQYKCLSTGVVTSRTFEATKSLVSVKYDNGDLSALPLEDLRLLPPDYPKYMSNCDPLLLAKNGDNTQASVITSSNVSSNQNNQNNGRNAQEPNQTPQVSQSHAETSLQSSTLGPHTEQELNHNDHRLNESIGPSIEEPQPTNKSTSESNGIRCEFIAEEDDDDEDEEEQAEDIARLDCLHDDSIIPQTDEIIDFITSDSNMKPQEKDQHLSDDGSDLHSITKDNMNIIKETHLPNVALESRASSEENNFGVEYCPWMFDGPPKRSKRHGRTYRDNYSVIRRGSDVIKVGDSAELMPRDESILPFIGKIDGFWATQRGEMRVRVRWYYRLVETEGEQYELKDGENALFETDHFDENDVQSIYRSTKILSWTEYSKNHLGHVNKNNDNSPKTFYLAGYYDPVRHIKHLRSDVKEAQ